MPNIIFAASILLNCINSQAHELLAVFRTGFIQTLKTEFIVKADGLVIIHCDTQNNFTDIPVFDNGCHDFILQIGYQAFALSLFTQHDAVQPVPFFFRIVVADHGEADNFLLVNNCERTPTNRCIVSRFQQRLGI